MNTIPATIPTTAEAAITFALDHLEPFEATSFLSDFRDGKDLEPWLDGWREDHVAGFLVRYKPNAA